jgi:hypothetical protein
MMATGGAALRSIGAERRHQFVVHDFHDHLSRGDRLHHLDADRALAHPGGEFARHIQRHVGFQQRPPHFAQGGVDVRLGQGAAPRQPIEDAADLIREAFEHGFKRI